MVKKRHPEGMRLARLLMVLSSISPLFILWGIRGNSLVPDSYFLPFCGTMVIVPNLFLWLRIRTARKLNEKRELIVGTAEDHRDHLLVYLFAILLPFYAADLGTYRDLAAALAAVGFIVFLFWHLNLHYMNLLFAVFDYRVFTVNPPADNNPLTSKVSQVLITRRTLVLPGERLVVYGLSDTVSMEV
ncbi:MAG: hypothetical protein MIO93_10420 [ANME-2 cluster archaeon]|nr:hypothetical protein [ANME-2 cluster archaeon]